MERDFVERQVPAADPRLYRILKQQVERILNEMPREDSLIASVRKAIAELMRDGDPKIAQPAKNRAMSRRTVQRRVKEDGLHFKKLTDDTRRRLAGNYPSDRTHTRTDIT